MRAVNDARIAAEFVSNEEIIRRAHERLEQGAWEYLVGGSESETTVRRNRLAFDKVAFRPRILRGVSQIDVSTTLLGHPLRIPAILAPVASLQMVDPGGAITATRAATTFGTMHCVSTSTLPSLEETAAATATPKIFQLYVQGDAAWLEAMVARVKRAGYAAIALTADVAHASRRERPMLSRWVPPSLRGEKPRDLNWQAALTWDTVDRVKDLAGLPLMLKGVQTAEDAELAVEHGVDYVWVSNHGGRQLDHCLGTIDVLPEIVSRLNGRARVIVDGGVLRGSDILKAVALGADVVAIGKLQGWGLAAAGEAGLVRVLEILEDELESAMGLNGLSSIAEVSRRHVAAADPVTDPHEMSAWVNMPENRIL